MNARGNAAWATSTTGRWKSKCQVWWNGVSADAIWREVFSNLLLHFSCCDYRFLRLGSIDGLPITWVARLDRVAIEYRNFGHLQF